MLLEEKLEWGPLATFVPNKHLPVYNWFYFKEGFSRDLIFKLKDLLNLKPPLLDPFCGSGTSLLACRELGWDAWGFDIMPICILASRAKTAEYQPERLKLYYKQLFSESFKPVRKQFPGWIKRFFLSPTLQDIAFFLPRIEGIAEAKYRDFFKLALITSAVKCSWIWRDGMVKVKKHPVPPFRKFFQRRLKRMIKEWERFPKKPCQIWIELGDARKLSLPDSCINTVITSPPYLNQVDYPSLYRVENWFCSPALPGLRSCIGLADPQAYFSDLESTLAELYRVCKPKARLAIIIGNAWVSGELIESDLRLAELAKEQGFRVEKTLVLNKRYALERRTIKRGILRESAVLLTKP